MTSSGERPEDADSRCFTYALRKSGAAEEEALMRITVSGVPVEMVRKKIKYMHIYVLPPDGRVKATVPLRLSDAAATAFIGSKLGWVAKQQEKMKSLPFRPPLSYVAGETLFVWGKPYVLELETGRGKKSLILDGDRAVLRVKEGSTFEQRERFVREWYRARLCEKAAEYLPAWELATGLKSSGWQTKYMKTRWGTCNTRTGKIWLNVELAKKPEECLKYVILHEVAHLKVGNHGQEFTAILDRHMPDWRVIKKRLNGSTG
jgi:predicted metal-dependent hydrolase